MKKLAAILVVLALVFCGCGSIQTPPIPEGCEGALSYKIPGLLPIGPAIIRGGFIVLCSKKPAVKEDVVKATVVAWTTIKTGDVITGMEYLLTEVPAAQDYALPAVIVLESIRPYLANQPVLNPCDQNIWLSLVKNIGLDAGATAEMYP